jgi:hypothetical protein
MAPGVRPGELANPRLLAIPAGVALVAAAAYLAQPKAPPPRPKPASLAQADLYLDIVGPALTRRCASCHNDDEARGGLSLVNYAALEQGGIDGPVLKPGDPLHSELFHRVTLPRADKLYMPQNGKPPLNRSQTAALRLWIQLGAPRTGLVGRFKLDAAQTMSLQNALASLGGGEEASTDEFAVDKSLPTVPAAPAAVRSHLEAVGFVVRPLSRASHLLVVDFTASRPLNADDFASLGRIGPQVRALNISEGQAKDAQLKALAPLTNLVRLRLDDDPITDAGLANLAALKSLTYLNLVGSKITDAGLSRLDALPKLHELYLWDTTVTPQAVERFKAAHPEVRVYAGLKAADVAKEPKMAPVN